MEKCVFSPSLVDDVITAPTKKEKPLAPPSCDKSKKREKKKKKKSPEAIVAQSFPVHKKKILLDLALSRNDHSPKHSIDVKCRPLLAFLNAHPDYVSTSSCSGRIALFHSMNSEDVDEDEIKKDPPLLVEGKALHADLEPLSFTPSGPSTTSPSLSDRSSLGAVLPKRMKTKRGGMEAKGWLLVKHGMLAPLEMEAVVWYFCGFPASTEAKEVDAHQRQQAEEDYLAACASGHHAWYSGELEGSEAELLCHLAAGPPSPSTLPSPPPFGDIALKMEPFVLHVECRTVEAGKTLLSAAVGDSGYRNSGMIPPGKKIMCAIRTTTGLGMEVPLQLDGQNYFAAPRENVRNGNDKNREGTSEEKKKKVDETQSHSTPQHPPSCFLPEGRAYLWGLLHRANQKMKANEKKIALLHKSVEERLNKNNNQ